jgi:site-specific DNA recombinase
VDEYVDAGASARSADRPALQKLLERLRENRDVDYVICHKVDRLARNRADDVAIGLTIHKAGAVLVSASEQIDESPAGTLLHGIMAAIAEFYSKNLSAEAKKGLYEKARRGGTPGYAPLGYLNSTTRMDGREVKTVVLDSERAPHIQWAFEAYSSGQWSITDLVEELARRGLRTRPTATRPAVPLTRSMIHRILSSPYYAGRLPFVGVEYEGRHQALVDEQTWQQVQDVLSGRRIAGDRSWRHEHYLKGTLFCARCGSRLGFGWSKGRGGRYAYFFCLGRSKKRTNCDLPYLPADKAEEHVMDWWGKVKLAPEVIKHVRDFVQGEMAEQKTKDQQILSTQRRRLTKLERTRQKLIDAYLAEAIPVADLKQRQEALQAEQREAERLIGLASVNHELLHKRLDIALGLLEHCERLYLGISDKDRRAFNQAFFDGLFIDRGGVKRAVLAAPFAQLHDISIGFAEEDEDDDQDGPGAGPEGPGGPPRRGSAKVLATTGSRQNPAPKEQGPGSNLVLLAEREGFEPSSDGTARNGFRDGMDLAQPCGLCGSCDSRCDSRPEQRRSCPPPSAFIRSRRPAPAEADPAGSDQILRLDRRQVSAHAVRTATCSRSARRTGQPRSRIVSR